MNPAKSGHKVNYWIKLVSPISNTIKSNKSKYGGNKIRYMSHEKIH